MVHFPDWKWDQREAEPGFCRNSVRAERGAERRPTSYLFPNSPSALPLRGCSPRNSFLTQEVSWEARSHTGRPLGPSGHVHLQRKPGAWKPSLFCPSGWGGPALQEVPEKLKGTCGELLVGSPAKNNL